MRTAIQKVYRNITEGTLHEKILIYMSLFHRESGIDNEEFEANKEHIFGSEARNVSLEDPYFKKLIE